jgi:hypothetical protein
MSRLREHRGKPLVGALVCALLSQMVVWRDVAPGVSVTSLKSVVPGLSRAQVQELLGEPFSEEPYVAHIEGNTVLRYSRPPWGAASFPQVDVVLQWGKVKSVYVHRAVWWGFDMHMAYCRSDGSTIENRDLTLLLGSA